MLKKKRALHFLGTGGARHVVYSQLRRSAGLLWELDGFQMWVDPGPGALVHALQSGVRPEQVDALFLSHRHLDHTGDANVVIEAMTEGGANKRGALFAPADALGVEPVVYSYARRFVASTEHLKEGKELHLSKAVSVTTPLAHKHGVETYGYRIHLPYLRIAHIVDTVWMDSLLSAYAGVELLIINMTLTESKLKILHLNTTDAERLIDGIKPKLAILTHLGKKVINAGPELFAARISERTGVKTIAAHDGLQLDLSALF